MSKSYFIGIDSDGTAFDSMTIKHRNAFIPCMIEVWGLQDESEKVREICEYINLYSPTRGIDRFSGLKVTFQRFAEAGITVPEYADLNGFLATGKLSNACLEQYLEDHDSPFLQQVLVWSHKADELFQAEVKTLAPFPGVLPVLKKAGEKADIAIISSASEKSLKEDWAKEGLINHITALYGQEFGTKKAQLQAAAAGKYVADHILMLGDAVGDYEAAQSVGAFFYPMIPGQEAQSWRELHDNYLDRFLENRFTDVQEELLKRFYKVVGEN